MKKYVLTKSLYEKKLNCVKRYINKKLSTKSYT